MLRAAVIDDFRAGSGGDRLGAWVAVEERAREALAATAAALLAHYRGGDRALAGAVLDATRERLRLLRDEVRAAADRLPASGPAAVAGPLERVTRALPTATAADLPRLMGLLDEAARALAAPGVDVPPEFRPEVSSCALGTHAHGHRGAHHHDPQPGGGGTPHRHEHVHARHGQGDPR